MNVHNGSTLTHPLIPNPRFKMPGLGESALKMLLYWQLLVIALFPAESAGSRFHSGPLLGI